MASNAMRHPALPDSRLRVLLSDCTAGLLQQMFFWGCDVSNADGNLLRQYGFDRNPSPGLQGTSCYRKPWEGGFIELHGACAGWYTEDSREGFSFIRPLNRVFRYLSSEPPVPGEWDRSHLLRGDPHRICEASKPFTGWWLDYEQWIQERTSPGYRDECYRAYQGLPATLRCLPPEKVLDWLRQFHQNPAKASRLRTRSSKTRKPSQGHADLRLRNHPSRPFRTASSI